MSVTTGGATCPGRLRECLWIGLFSILLSHADFAPARDFVVPVAVSNLVSNPANFFDLKGKTVRFTPSKDGSYQVQTLNVCQLVSCDQLLKERDAIGPWYAKGWSVPLPFAFPFGGNSWQRIYVNMDGNISFDKPESDYWPDRNPWSNGGMCSVAAAIDSRSVAGSEKMIAVFWGPYQDQSANSISIQATPDCMAITWSMMRAPWGQEVLGLNIFQARLYPSGVIEFTYPEMAESDGIVGLFTGKAVEGKLLSHWHHDGTAPDPGVDVDFADVYDAGTVLDLVITMKQDAATNVSSGRLNYQCWMNHDGVNDPVSISLFDDHAEMSCWLSASPRTDGWQIHGRRVDMFVSKVLLAGCKQCSVVWDVARSGRRGRAVRSGKDLKQFDMSAVTPGTVKFSKLDRPKFFKVEHSGNIFEVFHYPVVTRASERLLASVYKQMPAADDIAIVFTDFRFDDLFSHGDGALAANVAIQGIGNGNAHPHSTANIGSTQLQMSIETAWLGAPFFDESGIGKDGTQWFNFAHGVKFLAHECTHRWGMNLSFRNPATGKDEKLTDSHGHWRAGLDTTAMFPVRDIYIDRQPVGESVMSGYSWQQNADGTFSTSLYPFAVPGGYSALDLYVMGMLPADQVPPTTLIEDLKELSWNKFQGTSVPVRMEDVLKAMGPRRPDSTNAQHEFNMTFYIVHEPGRDADPAMLERAEQLSAAFTNYFSKATGGVMKVVPSGAAQSTPQNSPHTGRRRRRANPVPVAPVTQRSEASKTNAVSGDDR